MLCTQIVFVLTFRTIHVHNMFSPCSELGIFIYWACNSKNNLLSYCGLVDARISASKKDLPVIHVQMHSHYVHYLFTLSCSKKFKKWWINKTVSLHYWLSSKILSWLMSPIKQSLISQLWITIRGHSKTTWTKVYPILTPTLLKWTKMDILNTIYKLLSDPRRLSTNLQPTLLVYIVI